MHEIPGRKWTVWGVFQVRCFKWASLQNSREWHYLGRASREGAQS